MARRLSTVDDLVSGPEYIGERLGHIYLITNKVTGKRYVGQTRHTLSERWRSHRVRTGENLDSLASDIKQYGESSFSLMSLAAVPWEQLDTFEKFYIVQYTTLHPQGYNLTSGGHTTEYALISRKKISDSRIGMRFKSELKPFKTDTRGSRKAAEVRFKPVRGTHLVTGDVIELPFLSCRPGEFDPRLVSACCKGKRKHHRGYRWEYAEKA